MPHGISELCASTVLDRTPRCAVSAFQKSPLCYSGFIMAITILKKAQIQKDDLVTIPRKEYEVFKENQVPTIFLKGKSARVLDRRVAEALREYRQVKTKAIHSVRDLM